MRVIRRFLPAALAAAAFVAMFPAAAAFADLAAQCIAPRLLLLQRGLGGADGYLCRRGCHVVAARKFSRHEYSVSRRKVWRTRHDSNVRPLPSEGGDSHQYPVCRSCTYAILEHAGGSQVPKRADFCLQTSRH